MAALCSPAQSGGGRKIAAHYALLPGGVVDRPLITVDREGCIAAIEQYSDPSLLDSQPATEFHSGLLAPALVNAHTHLELSHLRGAIPEGCGYAGFAAAMARLRGNFTEEERRQAMIRADREMYDAGIGVAGDISNDEASFDIKASSLVDYHTFCEVFGLKINNFDSAHETLRTSRSRRGTMSLTPHSLYSLNDVLLKRLCSEGQGMLSIHFMESPAERELFECRGPLHEWFLTQGFECDFLHYASPAERLAACVPADRSVMLVHCTCVTQSDIDIIMNHFRAPVYWCLSPVSNRYITGLQPDAELLLRNGLNICLGTDSLASNRSLSMREELLSFGDISAVCVLRWATEGGAGALGRGDAGSLKVGSRCGLTVISGIDLARDRFTDRLSVKRIL